MTAIMIKTQGVKAVIKKETVVMTIPNLTKKKDVGDDEEEKDDEFVKTPSNSTDDEDITNAEDKDKGDEDKGMDYTTNQFDDDVNVRLNEPVNTYEGLIQKKGVDAKMINVQQGIENLETTLNQVIEDAHVTLSTVTKKTKILITSSCYSSDLASKFLNFLDIPHTDVEIISPMDVHVHHENDPFNTQVTALVDEHLDSRLRATRDEFMSYLSASITVRITEQVKSQLPQILPKEVSNFAPVVIKSMVTVSLEHAVLAKESSQPKRSRKDKDKDEDPSAGSGPSPPFRPGRVPFSVRGFSLVLSDPEGGLRVVLEVMLFAGEGLSGLCLLSFGVPPMYCRWYEGSFYFLEFSWGFPSESLRAEAAPAGLDSDRSIRVDQEENVGNDDEEPKGKVTSKYDWFTKPKQLEDPTDPYCNVGKTPQQGPTQSWLMTLASSANKPSKTFDKLMRASKDFSAYIMNGLKITNLT
ncbi:hypothetical protein Tco_0975385 [Tanacetum coccineum]|uniref:Uncharacterized protein n=1 Tax=Tanacetum coccineum TaxID=301880 RepID=A0ABQ5EEB4_9ASTR